MITAAEAAPHARGILAREVFEQLPRQLQEIYAVSIAGDPFCLKVEAILTDRRILSAHEAKEKQRRCVLETTVVNGVVKFAAIPGEFLALLCVEK